MNRTEKLAKSVATLFGAPLNNITSLLGNTIAYISPEFAGYWDNRNNDSEKAWAVRKESGLTWKQYYDYSDEVKRQKEIRGANTATNKDSLNAILLQNWTKEQKEKVWEAVRGNSKKSLDAQYATYNLADGKVSMENAYNYLKDSNIQNKEEIWEELFPGKTTYSEYAKKHQ